MSSGTGRRWAVMQVTLLLIAGVVCVPAKGQNQVQTAGQASVMEGYWREPSGGVIEVYACGGELCAKLYALTRPNGPKFDEKNSSAELRQRPLCGLVIGEGFHRVDATHAEDGHIYDPNSGRTYSATMMLSGDRLLLRGYVGMKLFGRTEEWQRANPLPSACVAPPAR